MSRLTQLSALGFAFAAALLASAPLMLLLDRSFELDSVVVIVMALVVALLVPTLAAVLCWRLLKGWQPQGLWLTAIVTGLGLAGITALAL